MTERVAKWVVHPSQRGFSDPLLPPHTCKCRPRKRRTAAELLVLRFFGQCNSELDRRIDWLTYRWYWG